LVTNMRGNQKEIPPIFYLFTFLFHVNNHYVCEVKYCQLFTGHIAVPLLILKWQTLCIFNEWTMTEYFDVESEKLFCVDKHFLNVNVSTVQGWVKWIKEAEVGGEQSHDKPKMLVLALQECLVISARFVNWYTVTIS